MKKTVCGVFYTIFVLFALAGMVGAAVLYPTHAANGTSAAYFTMIVFPTAFLLSGLTGIRFRYWHIPAVAAWLGLSGYLLFTEGWDPAWFILLTLYLLLSLASGIVGTALRRRQPSDSPK